MPTKQISMSLWNCLAQTYPMSQLRLWSFQNRRMNLLAHAASWFTIAAPWLKKLRVSQFVTTALKQSQFVTTALKQSQYIPPALKQL
jgi:hypothetical protein